METLNNSKRKVNKTAFGIVAGVACLLLFVFLLSRFTKKKAEPVPQLVEMSILAGPNASPKSDDHSTNGVLQQRLSNLQLLLQQYNTGAAAGQDKAALQNFRTSILLAEEAFRFSIDSIWISAITDKNTSSLQLKTIDAYKSSLDSIRTVNSSLNIATADDDFVPDRKAFLQLRDKLMEKTNRIALLESSIEIMSKRAARDTSGIGAERVNEIQVADAALLEKKVTELTTGNQRLQQEIERLRKPPVEAAKNSTTEEVLLSKNTALQQKVNSVNAELQLVMVDCNLSRVDATQIISNSKQRKQLLSEASTILTNLSASSDAVIRNKVKEKIVRLNQVAANTRD